MATRAFQATGAAGSTPVAVPSPLNGADTESSRDELRSIIDCAHEAFVSMDSDGLITYWNPEAERTFGWSRDEAIGRVLAKTIIPQQHREAHCQGLQRFLSTGDGPVLNRRFEMDALHRDGSQFPVELTISAQKSGGRHSFNAFLHDISERKGAEQELRLARELALAVGEAEDVEQALSLSVQTVCETVCLSAGQAWVVNGDLSRLVLSPGWFADSPHLGRFRQASEEVSFEPGTAFIGKAWATGQPVWVKDLGSDPECMRADVAREIGLGSALAVPVLAGDRVIAVMEFLLRECRERDERMIRLLCAVTAQLSSLVRRKRTEDALRRRELQLAQAQRVARIGSWEWHIARNEVTWSKQLYRIFGQDEDTFGATYEAFLEIVHPEDRAHAADVIGKAMERTGPFEFEHRIVHGDGSSRVVQCHGEVVTDANGAPVKMVGTCQDVTERRHAEEQIALVRELALSIGEAPTVQEAVELTLRTICDRTGWKLGQAWVPAAAGTYLECSAAWFGRSPELEPFRRRSESMTFESGEGLPGNVWSKRTPVWVADVRSDQSFVRAPLARDVGIGAGLGVPVLAGEDVVAVLEFFVVEPCPRDEDLIGVVSAAAAQLGFLIRRKQAEEALRKSEERFRLLVENAKDYAMVMLDSSGHVESWNQGAERIVGYSAEEMVGYHVSRLYTPEAVEQAQPEWHMVLAARHGHYEESEWRVRSDGLRFWADVVITPLYEGEELRGFSYITRDVSEQKRADDELRRLCAIVEHSEDAIVSTTVEKGVITSWNPGAERLFGYSAREVIGRSISVLIPAERGDEHEQLLSRVREQKRSEQHETEAVRKNGSRVDVSLTVSPIKDGSGDMVGISMIARDVTDRRRAERYLEQAFGAYVDPEVADHILREGLAMEAKEADVTMMFVDIRDFTAFAEQYEPREVLATLNWLFELAVPIITSKGGHVDKFVGDGLLGTFGVPEHLPDHADCALEAALEIETLVREQFQGDLEIGIGIDSGTVVAGNVGGGGRLDFTVIGDAVNMASRVEAATRDTGDIVLISERTKDALQHTVTALIERRTVSMKGKRSPVALYALSNRPGPAN